MRRATIVGPASENLHMRRHTIRKASNGRGPPKESTLRSEAQLATASEGCAVAIVRSEVEDTFSGAVGLDRASERAYICLGQSLPTMQLP